MDINAATEGNNPIFGSSRKKGGANTEESEGNGLGASGSEHENIVTELTSPAKILTDLTSPGRHQLELSAESGLKLLPGKMSTPALMAKEIENQTGHKPKLSKESLLPRIETFTMSAQYFKRPLDQIVQNKDYIDTHLQHIETTRIQKKEEITPIKSARKVKLQSKSPTAAK